MNKGRKKNKTIVKVFAACFVFFIMALLLFIFKGFIPSPKLDLPYLISPKIDLSNNMVFRKALIKNNVGFESIEQATTSSVLIIKLDKNSYAYLSTLKDPFDQAQILSKILTRIGIEEPTKKLRYVDLRFEKAVIKFLQ